MAVIPFFKATILARSIDVSREVGVVAKPKNASNVTVTVTSLRDGVGTIDSVCL